MAAILPPVAEEHPELAIEVNVEGTRRIVEALRDKPGVPLVFTSSVAVFGPTADAVQPVSPETDAPHPRGAYAETKFQAERLIEGAGIAFVTLRLAATAYTALDLRDRNHVFTIPLENRIEFCHTDDSSLAIVNAVMRFGAVKGKTLVISGGPGQGMLYGELLGGVLQLFGLPLPPRGKFTREPAYLDW